MNQDNINKFKTVDTYKGFRIETNGYYFQGGGQEAYTLEGIKYQIDNFTGVTFYRNPTEYEIKFGEGAIHYKTYLVRDLRLRKDGLLQVRLKDKIDGLIYTRK
jgi:hypothetical protein